MLDYLTVCLDATEQEELRRHLASGCPACIGALAEAQATLAKLPLALDPVTPPPAVKQRLMDRINRANESGPAPMKLTAPDQLPDSPALRIFRIFVPAAVAAGI